MASFRHQETDLTRGINITTLPPRVMVARPGPTAIQFFDQAPTTMNASQMDGAEFVAQKTLKDFERGKVVFYPGRTPVRIITCATRPR